MIIRKAISLDAQAVFDIRNVSIQVLCKGFYPDDLLAAWTDGDSPTEGFTNFVEQYIYVVEIDGAIVACGALDTTNNQIDAIFVDPQHKNKGLGTAIVKHLEAIALTEGADVPLYLEATLNAAPFYRKLGFVGETVSQYHSPRGFSLDCIKMKKALLHSNANG